MARIAARTLIAALCCGFLAASPALAQKSGPLTEKPSAEPLADLIDSIIDTVVIISTSDNPSDTADLGVPNLNLSPDEPLDDFFRDFFDRQQRGEGTPMPTAEGSGFVIDPSGIVVTNYHVVEDSDRIEVTFNDGSKLPAQVLGRDKDVDIAVLKVKPPHPLKAAKFGNSDQLRMGQTVVALGNPFGVGLSASSGIISGRNRDMRTGRYDNFIQTDASINKGNSGGPLFNMQGEVIGINTAILSPTGGSVGIGFAVPVATVQPVIAQLERYGEVRRGYIGLRVQDVPADIAGRLKLKNTEGAMVAGLVKDAPAAKAGLKVGDVIVSFDGKEVTNSRVLQRVVADTAPDRDAELVILRDGKETRLRCHVARLREAAMAETPKGDSEPARPSGDR